MRNTILAVSFVSLILSSGALGAPVEDTKPAVTPGTPSGVGNPNTVVCRAPQPIPGSGQLGPQVCLRNSDWWKVAMNGKDVAPDGQSLIAKATVDNPIGEGDPDAVTCRTGKVVASGLGQLPHASNARDSQEICRTNRFWANAIKRVDYGPAYGPGGYPLSPGDPYPDSGHVQSGMSLPSLAGPPH